MTLPFFYIEEYTPGQKLITLTEDESKHIITVLRMKMGEQMHLTDGKGHLLTVEIADDHKKKCSVKILSTVNRQPSTKKVTIAISLLKNISRLEWFLEKATEIGVAEIIPLLCTRTERQNFRHDRMKNILVSAMLQSQQCWLPVLQEPIKFQDFCVSKFEDCNRLIAHCEEQSKQSLSNLQIFKSSNFVIAIGPEGDFTSEEIQLASNNQFIPVTLGETRLRTETAGVVAATLLCVQ
ncbi:MAG: 16S rRNA (uracil(1498)-N(3))-methyltransferase [Sphingobacteriales bacterium]|nr:16S rRNA (uracil(1498)-N(3))-methyltransferase [Sphingobacteriales bacterium]MBI3718364.1 16S rRNA (uracil(1498)-N(3))-methyltransferase [Sphingobacteriales bacterium]